jgi:hypothetical protein
MELLSSGKATHNQLGHFMINASQQEIEGKTGIEPDPTTNSSQETDTNANHEALGMTVEEVKRMISNRPYGLSMRSVGRGYKPLKNSTRDVHPRLQADLSEKFESASLNAKKQEEARFTAHNISEIATLAPGKYIGVAEGWATKDSIPDDVYVIQYTTLTRGNHKYPYAPYGDSRGGQYLAYNLLLKEQDALGVWEALKKQPELLRELADMMATSPQTLTNDGQKTLMSEEQWANVRPPYDEWRNINGDVSRIAFRTSPNHGPTQSYIAEF